MKNKKLYLWLSLFLIPLCTILTQCMGTKTKADPRGESYAGSASCIKCHQSIYQAYFSTPHGQSSKPASVHNIHGSFVPGQNSFSFSNTLKVVMEKRDSGLYQVAYDHSRQTIAKRFDIMFGTAKAETYLYWQGDQLFQLPISYFSALHSWTNSPGYSIPAYFDRPIVTRCFECHASYISELPNPSIERHDVKFDKASIVYGIDCERCHGPSARHVDFQTSHPEEKKAMYITAFKNLTRAQKLDACAVCHSGNADTYLESTFKFKMGDTLANFKEPTFLKHQELTPESIDVHGNQNGLLKASKCFLMSNMDCNTCHNTHERKPATLLWYSQRCTSCHTNANYNTCKMATSLGAAINNNCIDCHMPARPSNVINVESAGGKVVIPYLVRTHYIAIYPGESKKIVAFIKGVK